MVSGGGHVKTKSVPSGWLQLDGRRLDCGPYMSGALEARVQLERHRTTPLQQLTLGGLTGIFHAGRVKRLWVNDEKYGRRFLSSTDILQVDLSNLALISHKVVAENPKLLISAGWTLITRSGTVGRMAFARPDMEGLACSEDILRVVPNAEKIPAGYLYAYLSSKFGVPLVVGGTYGAIIQHIEPEHIAELPVPRLDEKLERNAHELVEQAAHLRAAAAAEIAAIQQELIEALKLPELRKASVSSFSVNAVVASTLNLRLDAPYHSDAALRALHAVGQGAHPVASLSTVVKRYFKPPMFKRLWVDDSSYGRQFISGIDAYRFQAESVRYVSRKTPRFDEFILEEGTVIFQAAGQIYGLFGQPLFVHGWLVGLFAADDLYRLVPHTVEDGGYLYAFLRTSVGQLLLKREACGNSIPRVWDPHVRDIRIPWPDEAVRSEFGKAVVRAHSEIERARAAEMNAVTLVEHAIESGAN
jgi:type I restriction enzyme S subunit